MEKTTVFNLIIIDESGSMSPLVKQTVSGCNETLGVIRSLQKEFGDKQRQLVSIYLFQSGTVPSRYLYKNKPITEVDDLNTEVYRPCGCTPMLDAIGSTMTDLEAVAETHEDATGTITIITDGMENSSRQYTHHQAGMIIDRFKERGWAVNFIGANIDVEQVASKIHIDKENAMAFTSDQTGTAEMWDNFSDMLYASNSECFIAEEQAQAISSAPLSKEERVNIRKRNAKSFFNRKK